MCLRCCWADRSGDDTSSGAGIGTLDQMGPKRTVSDGLQYASFVVLDDPEPRRRGLVESESLAKELPARCMSDRRDAGMGDPAFRGNGEELLDQLRRTPQHLDAVLGTGFLLEHAR